MPSRFLIGLGAGLIAAVVFASATTGPLLARFALYFITPLPLFLAGLGWGWPTVLLAGITGSALVTAVFSPLTGLVFGLSQAGPAVLLCHLALLNRSVPTADNGQPSEQAAVEWYPVGHLVFWAALMSGLLAILSLILLGADLDALRASLKSFVEQTVKAQLPESNIPGPLQGADAEQLAEIALYVLPAATALTWMGGLLFNLWLAGRITLASGRLTRPWPDLAALTYPRGVPLMLAMAMAGTFFSGYPALAASGFAGAFFLAYVLLGLAIIHFVTRGETWRPFALWGLYTGLLFVNTIMSPLLALLGLSESFFPLRRPQRAPPGGPATKI